jgi:hypothetical protein
MITGTSGELKGVKKEIENERLSRGRRTLEILLEEDEFTIPEDQIVDIPFQNEEVEIGNALIDIQVGEFFEQKVVSDRSLLDPLAINENIIPFQAEIHYFDFDLSSQRQVDVQNSNALCNVPTIQNSIQDANVSTEIPIFSNDLFK